MSALSVVKRFYEAFGEGDLQQALALLDDDIIWELSGPTSIPYFGTYNGRQGVEAFFDKLFQVEQVIEFQPKEFIADETKVVVLGEERCKAIKTDIEFMVEWTQTFWISDNKIIKWKEIIDTHPIVRAYTGEKDD